MCFEDASGGDGHSGPFIQVEVVELGARFRAEGDAMAAAIDELVFSSFPDFVIATAANGVEFSKGVAGCFCFSDCGEAFFFAEPVAGFAFAPRGPFFVFHRYGRERVWDAWFGQTCLRVNSLNSCGGGEVVKNR